jgi:hypothetical protein
MPIQKVKRNLVRTNDSVVCEAQQTIVSFVRLNKRHIPISGHIPHIVK